MEQSSLGSAPNNGTISSAGAESLNFVNPCRKLDRRDPSADLTYATLTSPDILLGT
jgi:hypothetical protein